MAISFYHNHYDLLDRWPVRMGENQFYFNQFKQPSIPESEIGEDDPALTHSITGTRSRVWHQCDREPIAEALGSSFERVSELLGYFPKPTFVFDKIIKLDRRPWWNQEITLPHRYLIRVGNTSFESRSVETAYAQVRFLQNQQIPGYFSGICLPDDVDVDTVNIGELKDRFNFSLTGEGTTYQTGVSDRESLRLTQVHPFIRKGDLSSDIFHGISLSCTGSDDYKYLFNIPIVMMGKSSDRFNELQNGVLNSPLEFSNADWGEDNSPVLNDSSIELTERKVDSTDAIRLLFRPTGQNDSAKPVKVSVEGTITDYNKSKLWLKDKHFNVSNVYENPYAIQISYESGLAYQTDGNMNQHLEMAIITLANAEIAVNLPVSDSASRIYNEHRTPIYDENRNVKNPNFLNPLGDRIGHARAWDLILPKADGVKGTAHYLRY